MGWDYETERDEQVEENGPVDREEKEEEEEEEEEEEWEEVPPEAMIQPPPRLPLPADRVEAAVPESAPRPKGGRCAICMDRWAATLFLPCGHYAACVTCARRVVLGSST